MISDSIIVAIITGVVTSGGSILGFVTAEKNRRKSIYDEHMARLNEMEGRLSKQIADDKNEYIVGIANVKSDLADVKADVQKMKEIRAELKSDFEKTEIAITARIDNLEQLQNKHNNIIERTYKLETETEVLDQKISVANHRIADLEAKT